MLKKFSATGLSWLWLAIVVLLIDRIAKYATVSHLNLGEPIEVLPIFNLTLSYNTGAAFGFLHTASGWQNIFLGTLAVVISLFILYWLARTKRNDYCVNIGLGFVLGGALGNVWDRIQYGYVIDFFSFHLGDWYFAIFNTADSAITLGAFLLIVNWLWQESKNKK